MRAIQYLFLPFNLSYVTLLCNWSLSISLLYVRHCVVSLKVLLAELNQELVIFIIFILEIFVFLLLSIVIILNEVLICEIMHTVWMRYLRLIKCLSGCVHAWTSGNSHLLDCRLGLNNVTSHYFLHAGFFLMRRGD